MKTGIQLIQQERREQIYKHRRTTLKDVLTNNSGQLISAASMLMADNNCFGTDAQRIKVYTACVPTGWDLNLWVKLLNKNYEARLVIAGALVAAEIDRLNCE